MVMASKSRARQPATPRRVALLMLQALAYLAMVGLAYAIGNHGRDVDQFVNTAFALIVLVGFPAAWIAMEREALGWWLLLIVPVNAAVTWAVFVVGYFMFNFHLSLPS